MKAAVKFALAATLVASGSASQPHHHQHRHLHAKKHEQGSPIEKRDAVTNYVAGPTETAYVFQDGGAVGVDEAKKCLKDGKCLVVGSTVPTFTPPPPPPAPSSTSSAAQFFESKPAPAPSSSAAPSPAPAPAPAPQANGASTNGKFPNKQIPCSKLPVEYGAVSLDWLGLDGWAGIQNTGGWTKGLAISNIVTETGGGCKRGCFCQYACAAGWGSSQWPPTSQGLTGQSIGGLFCNDDGMLELTNPDSDTLCTEGVGGVTVVNKLSQVASICKTVYPGTEKMAIPAVTNPGETRALNNPDAKVSYFWEGKPTSNQYYINLAGVPKEEACCWDPPSQLAGKAGNYAPMNLGVGTDIFGITYLSLFANQPSSTALLDYNVEITGDVTAPCKYTVGSGYTGGGNGCTTAIKSKGGQAQIVLTNA